VAVEAIPPFLMAGFRYTAAGALLFAWARFRGAPLPSRTEWGATAIVGGLLLLGGNGLLCWAELRVPTGLAALIIATVPLWMMVERWLLEGVRPPALALVGLGLGFSGLAILVGPSLVHPSGGEVLWLGLILFGAMCWATGSVLSRRVPLPAAPLMATAMKMLCGGAMLVVVGLVGGEGARLSAAEFGGPPGLALAYLVVFGSLVGFTAYVWLLGVASPSAVSTYAFVNPIVAMLLGALFLHETMTARMLLAAAVTLVGVGFITASSSPRKGPEAGRKTGFARARKTAGKRPSADREAVAPGVVEVAE
jgi:drug/metabolite transporter (DMT)-like permease